MTDFSSSRIFRAVVAASTAFVIATSGPAPALASSAGSSSNGSKVEIPTPVDPEPDVPEPSDPQPEGPGQEEPGLPSIDNRPQVVADGLEQRGDVIGTGNKPAIALRFDHHLAQFGDKVLPLLKKYRLPWGQMINAGRVNNPTYDDNWTWEQLATATHNTGGEVWNHAMTHRSFTTAEEADYEITEGLAYLRNNLPSLYIDGWAGPGQPHLMGMEGSDTPEKFYGTYPGRLVLNQHAFVRGYYDGPFHKLDGDNLVGQVHITIDKQKDGRVQQYIRRAVSGGTGVTLMLHPNYLDRAGYLSTNELDAALAYIAHLRDTDQIEVLSNTGILMADSSLAEGHGNLLDIDGAGDLNGEVTSDVPRALSVLGVPHELETWISGHGSATVRVEVESPTFPLSVEYSAELGETPNRFSVPVTPPLDATKITITVEGDGSYTGLSYQPI